jgi:hypothetical protein
MDGVQLGLLRYNIAGLSNVNVAGASLLNREATEEVLGTAKTGEALSNFARRLLFGLLSSL